MANVIIIRNIRNTLTFDVCHVLMLGLVISDLDYCDIIHYGLPEFDLKRLQHVQNIGAKVVCK